MTSEKRGCPWSPGLRAPTVPMPNGAGSADASAVPKPPVQSCHDSTALRVTFSSPNRVSNSPALARSAAPERAVPRSTYAVTCLPTSTLARASESSSVPLGVTTLTGSPCSPSTKARPAFSSTALLLTTSRAGPETSHVAPPSRRIHARPPSGTSTVSPSTIRSRGYGFRPGSPAADTRSAPLMVRSSANVCFGETPPEALRCRQPATTSETTNPNATMVRFICIPGQRNHLTVPCPRTSTTLPSQAHQARRLQGSVRVWRCCRLGTHPWAIWSRFRQFLDGRRIQHALHRGAQILHVERLVEHEHVGPRNEVPPFLGRRAASHENHPGE